MNERLQELVELADSTIYDQLDSNALDPFVEKFATMIIQECIFTLLWHGLDDAVPYIKWMAKNKLGVKQ